MRKFILNKSKDDKLNKRGPIKDRLNHIHKTPHDDSSPGVLLTSPRTNKFEQTNKPNIERKRKHVKRLYNNHTIIYQLLVITTISYGIITFNNAPYCSNIVHGWSSDSPRPNNYDLAPPSPVDLITSFWTPRRNNKRQTVIDDSLTSNNDTFMQSDINSATNRGWFDLFGGIFHGHRPTSTRAPQSNTPRDSLDAHVKKILIPRVSGTGGNTVVRNYIVDTMKKLNYHVHLDEFHDHTPIGRVKFANIIATSDPHACKQLAIACHHDSKMMDGFLGATDSAVPCAMMLELAQTFKQSFRPNGDSSPASERLGLMFVFFDGEEAFEEWTETDSLYGSRHLAAKWEKQKAPAHCQDLNSELNRLDLLMVLDLIGASDTNFVMFNRSLKHHYQNLQKYENIYLTNKLKLQGARLRQARSFRNGFIPLEMMQDDHVPFMQRGVPILSLLAHPFPSVWHKVEDNYDAIDFAKTKQVLHALEKFVANYNISAR